MNLLSNYRNTLCIYTQFENDFSSNKKHSSVQRSTTNINMKLSDVEWYLLDNTSFKDHLYIRLYSIYLECYSYSKDYEFTTLGSDEINYYDCSDVGSQNTRETRDTIEINSGSIILLSNSRDSLTDRYYDIHPNSDFKRLLEKIFRDSLSEQQIDSLKEFVKEKEKSIYYIKLKSDKTTVSLPKELISQGVTFPISLLNCQ